MEIIQLYSKSKDVVNSSSDMPSGQLTIGASESVMIYWLPEIIMDFMEKYPKVEIMIKSIDYHNLSNQLKNGEIDIALLVEGSDWQEKHLVVNQVKRETLILVRTAISEKQKMKGTMLTTEYSCSWRPAVEEFLSRHEDDSILKVELPSVEAIKKYVLSGPGISMLPILLLR